MSSSTNPAVDLAEVEQFQEKVVRDTSGLTITVMSAIGDKLGLFKRLSSHGPTESEAFARKAGIDHRYAEEWLSIMTAGGYIHYDPQAREYSLPSAHARVLAEEGGPFFLGGTHQMLYGMLDVLDLVERAFLTGEGVPMSAYGADTWEGMERDMNGVYNAKLLHEWMPAMPQVASMLEEGVDVADVGCGSGRILIMLAQSYPNSNYMGFDLFEPVLDRARANALEEGVQDSIDFKVLDAEQGLPNKFDIVMTFEVVHDAAQPVRLLTAIRKSLKEGGRYICMDIECEEGLEDNRGPLATARYGASILYCMSTSLANEGVALGTMGLHDAKMKELCMEAGFKSVRKVPLEGSIHSIYDASA
ncbi:MAG: class I SAM-dependent methyltransferase [Anaerolineales bacterium]